MKILIASLLLLLAPGAEAQWRAEPQVARSISGEFIAHPIRPAYTSRFYRGDEQSISVEPAVLVISAERIKQALWRKLELSGSAKGKIHLRLRPARSPFEQATIVVDRGVTGWACQVDVPDALSPESFVRAVVHASLLEIANRRSDSRPAEVPLWLAEGLCQDLLAAERLEYLSPPPHRKDASMVVHRVMLNERRNNPIAHSQALLRQRAPLTFEELSWPSAEQLSPEQIELFRSSAHLFVWQLSQLRNGPACLRATLDRLSQNLNWQFAFLDAFQAHFSSPLDIEKWWALQLVQLTGRDLTQAWTPETTWEKLEEVLEARAEVRSHPRELPRPAEVSLQTIIRDWDGLSQRPALQRKLRELDLLRPLAAQEFIGLVDDYRAVIRGYLDRQSFSGTFFGLVKRKGPIRNRLAEETIQQLNLLDARRLVLRPSVPPEQPVNGGGDQRLTAR